MKIALSLLASCMIFAASAQAPQKAETPTKEIVKGDTAPNFSYTDKNGKKINLSDLKGKVVMINFWATWCPPCRKELPELQKLVWNKYKSNPNFVLLCFAREESWDKISSFNEKYRYTLPLYPDLDRKIFSQFAPNTIPRNYIIGKDGKVIYASFGYEEKEFNDLIKALSEALK